MSINPTITLEDACGLELCINQDIYLSLSEGRTTMPLLEILDLDVDPKLMLEFILHDNFVPRHILREFAADCAFRVLPVFERVRPKDDRPRQAIEIVRKQARNFEAEKNLREARHKAKAALDSLTAGNREDLLPRRGVKVSSRGPNFPIRAAQAACACSRRNAGRAAQNTFWIASSAQADRRAEWQWQIDRLKILLNRD